MENVLSIWTIFDWENYFDLTHVCSSLYKVMLVEPQFVQVYEKTECN